MRQLLLSLLLLLPSAVFAATPLAGWSHVAKITIDATKVDAAIPVIPVFLSKGDTAFWAALSGGDDIRITEDDGTTILDHYLVPTLVDFGTTGTACLLVNVASIISTGSNVDFAIHVGNALASSTSDSAAVFAGTDIEAFYLPGVTDLDLAGSHDLTGVNWDRGTDTAASDIEGIPAAVYNGSNQYHYHTGVPVANWPLTLTAWANPDDTTHLGRILSLSSTSSDTPLAILEAGGTAASGKVRGLFRGNSGSLSIALSTGSYVANDWNQLAARRNTDTNESYGVLDGVRGSGDATSISTPTFTTVGIGALVRASVGNYFKGPIAVGAIHSENRADDYTSTEHTAWTDADFLTWGATEGATDTGWVELTGSTYTGWTDSGTYWWDEVPAETNSTTIVFTGADLSAIPDGATISGWECRLEYTGADDGAKELYEDVLQPVIAGTQSGDNQARGLATQWIDSSIQSADFGGDTDKWSLTPTVAAMKSSTTGVAIRVLSDGGGGDAEARIYSVSIRVHWGGGATGPTAADKARGFFGVSP